MCARVKSHGPRRLVSAGNSAGLHSADFGENTISTRFESSCPLAYNAARGMHADTKIYILYMHFRNAQRVTTSLPASLDRGHYTHMPFASLVLIFGFELKLSYISKVYTVQQIYLIISSKTGTS